MTAKSADAVRHRDTEHCDSYQDQRDGPIWVWIESERDSEPYGSPESRIVPVRLARSTSAARRKSSDRRDHADS